MKYIVTEKAQRPADMNGHCFYCQRKIGEYHKAECVLINKPCVIEVKIKIVKDYPACWDKELIEFHLNESSWCADNIVEDLNDFISKLEKIGSCLCAEDYFEGKCIDDNKGLDGVYIDEE